MLNKMLNMQRELDNAIYKEHKCKFDEKKARLALLDEIGELNHELKPTWCWWKKTVGEVDSEKVLEELVDAFHFGMSICNNTYSEGKRLSEYTFSSAYHNTYHEDYKMMSYAVKEDGVTTVEWLITIMYKLGFQMKDVYEMYLKKNNVNYERLKNGY